MIRGSRSLQADEARPYDEAYPSPASKASQTRDDADVNGWNRNDWNGRVYENYAMDLGVIQILNIRSFRLSSPYHHYTVPLPQL